MDLLEIFKKFESGHITMDDEKARQIASLVSKNQDEHGSSDYFPISEDIDTFLSIIDDYKKLNKRQVSLAQILEIAENYDLWDSDLENIEDIEARLFFIRDLVNMAYKSKAE